MELPSLQNGTRGIMFKLIKQLLTLLTPIQRKQFYLLQILVVIMSFAEIMGVASIIPFMVLVGDMSQLEQDTVIAQVYQASGISSESQFVFILGVGVLIMLFFSAAVSMLTTWKLAIFANKAGTEIGVRLYTHYLKQDWLFHTSGSSAELTKKIAVETIRVTNGVLSPLMAMNARIILSITMSLALFIYDPKVAMVGIVIFSIAYFLLFSLVKVRLHDNGVTISEVHEHRFRLMNEAFGGIRDVLLLGRTSDFIQRFTKASDKLANSQGINMALTQMPRYLMELIAFGSMIALLLYLINSHNGNLGLVLPILSVYALASFKLLPAFQQIYGSLSTLKASIPAFESIQQDLINSTMQQLTISKPDSAFLKLEQQITFENITFSYPGKSEPVLKALNMSISANSVVGIVGSSGAGKSTIIDILLSLISPQHGFLKVDNKIIDKKNRRLWQNSVGFVPQSIFLSEGSIAENIAFGIPKNQIDIDKVKKALMLSNLSELVQILDNGMDTKVGERGVQLSGGQRQRVGIARALYHEAEILVFDEATSSLDGITEKMIIDAIHDFSGKKTIIMIAHRIKTVEKCDQIFFIENGKVADQGTYLELMKKNERFRNMAAHA